MYFIDLIIVILDIEKNYFYEKDQIENVLF